MRGIITGDWHLRHTPPKISNDKDWFEVQRKMVNKIVDLCQEHSCSLYNTGDLYNSINDTTFDLIRLVQDSALKLDRFGQKFYLLCGNHDLPYHSSENLDKSAIGVTLKSLNIYHMSDSEVKCGNFDEETPNEEIIAKHVLCFPDMDSIPPNVNAYTAPMLLKEYNKARFMFLGDYHHHFVYGHNDRYIINPGCTTIQVADMLDYECGVYYVDTEKEVIEWIPLNIAQEFYDKCEIEPDIDMEAFADSIKIKDVTFDFDSNVEKALQDQDDNVKDKVHSWQGL